MIESRNDKVFESFIMTRSAHVAGRHLALRSLSLRKALRTVLRGQSLGSEHLELKKFVRARNADFGPTQTLMSAILCLLWVHGSTLTIREIAAPFGDAAARRDRLWAPMYELRCQGGNQLAARRLRIEALCAGCALCLLLEVLNALELELMLSDVKLTVASPNTLPHVATERRLTHAVLQAPFPWSAADPDLLLARPGSGGFFGHDSIHPTALGNVMAVGGTGSGKTASVVSVMLRALLRYREVGGMRSSVLVIDPKRELATIVQETLADRGELDRLLVIGECPPVAMFSTDCPLSPGERLDKLRAFEPAMVGAAQGNNGYWTRLGMNMLRDMLVLEAAYFAATGQRLFDMLIRLVQCRHSNGRSSWARLRDVLSHSRLGHRQLKAVNEALLRCLDAGAVNSEARNVMSVYTGSNDLLEQWNYLCMGALDTLGSHLADTYIENLVDFDVLPDAYKPRTDISQQIDAGMVVLFCPDARQSHDMIACALKAKWYESVFARRGLARPVGVVIDEAHRFLTSDPETGEQDILDRCRAYRCVVVLATQSVSSLLHRLGSGATAATAVDIIIANTPSKFFFRSTDEATMARLQALLPPPPTRGPHIVSARPPSGLQPGEAYYMHADGRWGRDRADLDSLL